MREVVLLTIILTGGCRAGDSRSSSCPDESCVGEDCPVAITSIPVDRILDYGADRLLVSGADGTALVDGEATVAPSSTTEAVLGALGDADCLLMQAASAGLRRLVRRTPCSLSGSDELLGEWQEPRISFQRLGERVVVGHEDHSIEVLGDAVTLPSFDGVSIIRSGSTLAWRSGDGAWALNGVRTVDAALETFTMPIDNLQRLWRGSQGGSFIVSTLDPAGGTYSLSIATPVSSSLETILTGLPEDPSQVVDIDGIIYWVAQAKLWRQASGGPAVVADIGVGVGDLAVIQGRPVWTYAASSCPLFGD